MFRTSEILKDKVYQKRNGEHEIIVCFYQTPNYQHANNCKTFCNHVSETTQSFIVPEPLFHL